MKWMICIALFWPYLLNAETVVREETIEIKTSKGRIETIKNVIVEDPEILAKGGQTALAIHGFAHTGVTFVPLAKRQLSIQGSDPNKAIGRFIAPDLPGAQDRQESLAFGGRTLQADRNLVISLLDALGKRGQNISTLIGHSRGGMLVLMVQNQLLKQKSSLAKLGVKKTVLLAPTLPTNVSWAYADSGRALLKASGFVKVVPGQSFARIVVPPKAWLENFHTRRDRTLPDQLGTAQDIADSNVVSEESLVSGIQLVAPWFTGLRPSVSAGAFSPDKGTQLIVAAFEQDALFTSFDEHRKLFEHVVGKKPDNFFIAVSGPDATHGAYFFAPELLDQVCFRMGFPSAPAKL